MVGIKGLSQFSTGCLIIAICFQIIHLSVSDTKYECVSGYGGGRFGYGDDFELDEFGGRATGTLSCPQANSGSILVLRVGYGTSATPGRCESVRYCKEEYDTGDVIADRCDGRSSCFVDLMAPRYMACGRMSDYMLVEYECVDTWKTFEICENVSTVSRGSSIFITSPGYLSSRSPSAARGTQMCECIIQSHDDADLFLDYMQTKLSKSGDQCPYEYVLIESKQNLNQSSIDKEIEMCGRRHTGSKWFQGSIRLTYASGGPMRKTGLVAKFIVDNIGNPPRIEIECGSVNSSGLKLKDKPPKLSESQAPGITRTRIPADPWIEPEPMFSPQRPSRNLRDDFDRFLRMDEMEADEGPFDDVRESMLSPVGPLPPINGPPPPLTREPPPLRRPSPSHRRPPDFPLSDRIPAPRNRPAVDRTPDFRNWRINIPETPAPDVSASPQKTGTSVKRPAAQSPSPVRKIPAPTKPSPSLKINRPKPQNKGPGVIRQKNNRARRPAAKRPGNQSPKKVVDERGSTSQQASTENKHTTGSYVALVMGGIGAVLILGSVGILAIHNYRKRQRIKAKEAEYAMSGGSASSTYGQGWKVEEESVYATISDVDKHRSGCVNPAVNQELDLGAVDFPLEKFVGQQDNKVPTEMTSVQTRAEDNTTGVAVIEVHQHFGEDNGVELHVQDCLPPCEYSLAHQENGSSNACASCHITRPPRRKDANRGYDNNIGVKDKTK